MKKQYRKEEYVRIAAAINKSKNRLAFEMVTNLAADEGMFILAENKAVDAAPQLLEALEEIIRYTEQYPYDMGLESFAKQVASKAIKAARGEE